MTDAKGATAPGFRFPDLPERLRDPSIWMGCNATLILAAIHSQHQGHILWAEEQREVAWFLNRMANNLRESSHD